MGMVDFGIPKKETEWLRSSMKLDVVIEGGTFQGGTALDLSKRFNKVYTIEKSEEMFAVSKRKISQVENIIQLMGDTREHLPELVAENDNVLFWLDAHWSGGQTYGVNDECPLLEELEIIFSSNLQNFVVLVDDARLFLAPPPLPHDFNRWPSIKDICMAVPDGFDVIVQNDVVYVVPERIEMRKYLQRNSTSDWRERDNYTRSLMNRLRSGIKRIKNYARR